MRCMKKEKDKLMKRDERSYQLPRINDRLFTTVTSSDERKSTWERVSYLRRVAGRPLSKRSHQVDDQFLFLLLYDFRRRSLRVSRRRLAGDLALRTELWARHGLENYTRTHIFVTLWVVYTGWPKSKPPSWLMNQILNDFHNSFAADSWHWRK